MAKKNNLIQNPWVLFTIATLLLSAGWLMKSFPILIFVGFAPLFAISDQAKDHTSLWNRFELILLSLTLCLFSARLFDTQWLVVVLAQAIVFTLSFVGYSFAYQSLGNKLGKFTVIFFWLGTEYLLLKLPWSENTLFLADALLLQSTWLTWTYHLGYLGASLWILVVNLIFYLSFFHKKEFNGYYLAFGIALTILPILFSYQSESLGISRNEMITLYTQGTSDVTTNYAKQGELIARTAAWISVLIILLSLVKNKTRKK
jgi:apolipoprotein N-acyltransferase